jgi:uncharacterized protein with ATP-grasp and redox domains
VSHAAACPPDLEEGGFYSLKCIPCLAKGALTQCGFANATHEQTAICLRDFMTTLSEVAWDQGPSTVSVSSSLRARVAQVTGVPDAYAALKEMSSRLVEPIANDLWHHLTVTRGLSGLELLHACCRVAATGNLIDFGAFDPAEMMADLPRVMFAAAEDPLRHSAFPQLCEELAGATEIVIFLDNVGEHLFDLLLLKAVRLAFPAIGRFRIVVKRAPLLNDVTRADAEATRFKERLQEFCAAEPARPLPAGAVEVPQVEYVELSHGEPHQGGVWPRAHLEPTLSLTSPAPGKVVISKGQGNAEALLRAGRGIFFLLMSKCPVFANVLGVEFKERVLVRR